MRSTQKRVKELMKEMAEALGVRTKSEVWRALDGIRAEVADKVGPGVECFSISPYADFCWTIGVGMNAGPGRMVYRNMGFFPSDFVHDRDKVVADIRERFKLEGGAA